MQGMLEFFVILVAVGIYLGFGVVGAWLYDRHLKPRLYDE